MSTLETDLDGYRVSILYDSEDIKRCYVGSTSGLDVWPILSEEFKLKVYVMIFGSNST